MHTREVAVLLMALIMSIAVFAGEKQHTKIEIAVEGDEGSTEFSFDSDNAGFNLHDLEVGDTRKFDTDDGRAASVTRTEDGFEFDVDGQKIAVNDIDQVHDMHLGGGDQHVFVVEGVDDVKVVSSGGPGNVTLVTGATLDEATKLKIREVLTESGVPGEVLFIDGGEFESGGDAKHGERRQVRVIKKEVNVTN